MNHRDAKQLEIRNWNRGMLRLEYEDEDEI